MGKAYGCMKIFKNKQPPSITWHTYHKKMHILKENCAINIRDRARPRINAIHIQPRRY